MFFFHLLWWRVFAFMLYNLLKLSAEYNLSLGTQFPFSWTNSHFALNFYWNELKASYGLISNSAVSSIFMWIFLFCGCAVSCMLAESCWVTVSGAWWLADGLPCGFLPSQVTWLTSQDTSSVTCLTIFTAVLQIWWVPICDDQRFQAFAGLLYHQFLCSISNRSDFTYKPFGAC